MHARDHKSTEKFNLTYAKIIRYHNVEASWNVMAHAQTPDFVFRQNRWVHLHRWGRQFSRLPAAEVCASAFTVGSNAGHTMCRGSVKGTGYPLHLPVSPSLPLPCVTVCHQISTGVYHKYCVIPWTGFMSLREHPVVDHYEPFALQK